MKPKKLAEDCVQCGMCRGVCPALLVLREETVGPRAHMMLMKNNVEDESLFHCTLCRACEVECPANVGVHDEVLKARIKMTEAGKNTKANKKMIENIRKHGNPFGKVEKGKIPKDLYCC